MDNWHCGEPYIYNVIKCFITIQMSKVTKHDSNTDLRVHGSKSFDLDSVEERKRYQC
jgi:hypothetical protein